MQNKGVTLPLGKRGVLVSCLPNKSKLAGQEAIRVLQSVNAVRKSHCGTKPIKSFGSAVKCLLCMTLTIPADSSAPLLVERSLAVIMKKTF